MNAIALVDESDDNTASDINTPGVLVFNSTVQLRFRNRRAKELCEQIIRFENRKPANGVLPSVVTSLAEEIYRLLRIRTETKDWEQFQVRRVAGSPDHPVLLCGFGVLEADIAQSKIILIMHGTVPAYWHNRVLDRTREKFQLTSREVEILRHLLKGWTNKEIANTLKSSEQTVKEHVKHLLAKTGTSTRTGVVMKAVLCGLHLETGGETRGLSVAFGGSPQPDHGLFSNVAGQASYVR
jgi:DNA-binding CsgD family transcriptional regulator